MLSVKNPNKIPLKEYLQITEPTEGGQFHIEAPSHNRHSGFKRGRAYVLYIHVDMIEGLRFYVFGSDELEAEGRVH